MMKARYHDSQINMGKYHQDPMNQYQNRNPYPRNYYQMPMKQPNYVNRGYQQNIPRNTKVFQNYISESDLIKGKGFIGNRQTMEAIQHFSLIGRLIKTFSSLKNPVDPRHQELRKRKIEKREKEVKIGSIIFRPSKGDWQCRMDKCQNWNYAKRDKCNMCGVPKSGIPSLTPGIIQDHKTKPTEWKCRNCGFLNSMSKKECFKCNNQKN